MTLTQTLEAIILDTVRKHRKKILEILGVNTTPEPYKRPGKGRLTAADVRAIRELAAQGHAQTEIAKCFGCTQGNVSSIVSRRTWVNVV